MEKNWKRIKEASSLVVGIGFVMLFTSVSGIGCPIKWVTGISCAGCGMTRALLSAVQLQFGEAFHYHPLFWTMPFLVGLVFFRDKVPPKFAKIITGVVIVCFGAVYLARLFSPEDNVVTADLESGFLVRMWSQIFTLGEAGKRILRQ